MAGARTRGGGRQGRACPNPGRTPRSRGRGPKPAPPLPCVVRRCPTADGGGDARRPGAASAVVRDRSGGRHATGGAAATPLPPRGGPRSPYGSGGRASDGGSCAWRQADDAHAPPPRGPQPPPPPPPPPPPSPPPQPPPLPPPRPPVAPACGRASHTWASTAHRRVGGRRGGNTFSGGGRRPHPPNAGVPLVVRGARLGGREKNGRAAWPTTSWSSRRRGRRRLARPVTTSPARRPTRRRRRRPRLHSRPPLPLPPCMADDVRSTSTATTAPPHRRRCLAPAPRRRRLAQRVAASPERHPTRRQRRRRQSHTDPTPHHRASSHPDRLPMVGICHRELAQNR